MTFPETVKTTFWDIIDEMSLSISSFVNNPDKDFYVDASLIFKNDASNHFHGKRQYES